MTNWIKTSGKLVYEPNRHEFKKTHKMRTLIVELKRDQIDLYYQWFLTKQFGSWIQMQRPMFGTHVTVVKGNEQIHPSKMAAWKKYEGKEIDFEYSVEKIERHWQFWSMTVRSTKLEQIREELGLRPNFRFHITIGRQYDWQPMLDLREQVVRDAEFTPIVVKNVAIVRPMTVIPNRLLFEKNVPYFELVVNGNIVAHSKNWGHWNYHLKRGSLPKKLQTFGIEEFKYVGFVPE